MHALLFFFFFLSALICSLSANAPFAEAKTTRRSFSIDLIHRDSPLSPFYNSSMTQSEHLRNAALRSITRLNRFYQLSLNQKSSQSSPESIIVPNGGDYLMRIYIGTPPVERLAVADTGSDLIWVQCYPCKSPNCFPQEAQLFDPNNSSTFTLVPCASQSCTLLPPGQRACGKSNECDYLYAYGDNSYTIGELATESINFGSNSGTNNFPKSIFGCGYRNDVTFKRTRKATGLVGLGGGPLSLVSQLGDEIGHKFSYCLVPSTSPYNSKLKFGDEAILSGNGVVSTPLITNPSKPTFYYLNLEGISVGQDMVQNGQTSSGGNIVIDSGTTLTYLEQNFYKKFVDSVKKALGVEPAQNHPDPFDFCFSHDGANNNIELPDVVFHFTGANVPLKFENLFGTAANNLLCLLVVPTSDGDYIFGNKAQVNFQVEYDLQGKKVSFAPADCTKN